MTSAAESANQSAKNVAQSEPVKIGARVGIFAYGITHLLIAWLALQVAFGQGNERADQRGAFQALAEQPFGQVLLWILVIGFVAVALWRVEQAIWGFSYESDRTTNLRKRAISGGKAVIFVALAVIAGRTAAGGGAGRGHGPRGVRAARRPVLRCGRHRLMVAGGSKSVGRRKKSRDMDLHADQHGAGSPSDRAWVSSPKACRWPNRILVVCRDTVRPARGVRLDAALKSLASQSFGPYLLIVVALGLACYGVFCFFDARYHRV